MLTIFTAAYNRGHLLERLYVSLKKQSVREFEWLIVDDGSTDRTGQIVSEWIADGRKNGGEQKFEIVYIKQKHGGKHRAFNLGVQYARGDFFFCVDSDDYLLPNSVALILEWIKEIREDKVFAGVAGVRVMENGEALGKRMSIPLHGFVDASNLERDRYHMGADMAEVYRTDILKRFPFPEFENEYFISEGTVWNKIAEEGYVLRWHHEPIYVCEYLPDGLTRTGGIERHITNFCGLCETVKTALASGKWNYKMRWFLRFNVAARRRRVPVRERHCYVGMTGKQFYKLYLFCLPVYAVQFVSMKITKKLCGQIKIRTKRE